MSNPWTRRHILAAAATAAAGGLGLAATAGADDHRTYVLEQGEECIPVVPLAGDEPVEALYEWGKPDRSWSSEGTRELQRPETSLLFLYDGPNGLSLVIVHDKAEDETPGGTVSFEISGVPVDATWVVKDDLYDRETNVDTWELNGTVIEANESTVTDDYTDYDNATDSSENATNGNTTDSSENATALEDSENTGDYDQRTDEVDWWWTTGRTDGGALRGLAVDGLELRIEPAFNDAAELADKPNEGEITSWELLSGDRDDPDRTELDLDEPLTLRAETCKSDGTATETGSVARNETATDENATESTPEENVTESTTDENVTATDANETENGDN